MSVDLSILSQSQRIVVDSASGSSAVFGAGPPGSAGPIGPTGTDGQTVLNGAGAPSDGVGTDGDFYIDTSADALYGPKAAGTWTGTGPTSLVGPTGATGPTGPQGPSEYIVPIWAEESGTLSTGRNFSFGNGEDTWPVGRGLPIYVPSTHTCSLVAIGYSIGGTNMTLTCEIDGVVAHTLTGAGNVEIEELGTPAAITNAQELNWNCTARTGAAEHNLVVAYLKYTLI